MKIKYIADVVKWFDKVNGNTYHSVKITRCSDGKQLACEFQYGYGNHYEQTTIHELTVNKWIRPKRKSEYSHEFAERLGINWNVSKGLKRECVANGGL